MHLTKVHGKTSWCNLFHILLNKLGICESNLKLLMQLYSDIKTSVCINGEYTKPFYMHEGVY